MMNAAQQLMSNAFSAYVREWEREM